jgi:hypothetical protein
LSSREGGRKPAQLLTDQELDALSTQLATAGQIIELSRQKLFETRHFATSAGRELEQERQALKQCSEADIGLYIQYGKNLVELHETTTRCLSLHHELGENQDLAKGKIQELEKERQHLKQEHWAEITERTALESLAQEKINELEKERQRLNQEHWAEITKRTALESLAQEKIGELEKMVEEMVQEQEEAMSFTLDHSSSPEHWYEDVKKHNTPEAQIVSLSETTSSPENCPSQGALKHERTEIRHDAIYGGRPSKYRKCKGALMGAKIETISGYV